MRVTASRLDELQEKVNVLLKKTEVQENVTANILKIINMQQDQTRRLTRCVVCLSLASIALAVVLIVNTLL